MYQIMLGRIVHYVAYNGTCLAAMIIGESEEGGVDLAVFTSMKNVNGNKNYGMQFHSGVREDLMKRPGSYHLPEGTVQ